MRGTRRRLGSEGMFGSAGWLFADLMLALVMMSLLAAAITTRNAQPEPPPPPPPSPVDTTTTTSTTPPPAPPPGLLPDPVKLDVHVDTGGLLRNDPGAIGRTQQDMRGALAGPLAGRRVGVVLTFGTSPSGDIQRGVRVAGLFNDLVLRTSGDQFAGTGYRNFFQGGGDLDKITLEIFVYDH